MPVSDATVHLADVNVIEVVLWVDPIAAAVVDLEDQVRRFGFGLDW